MMDWKKKFGMNLKPATQKGSTQANIFAPPASYQSTSASTSGGAGNFLANTGMDAVTATMHYGMNSRKRQLDEDE